VSLLANPSLTPQILAGVSLLANPSLTPQILVGVSLLANPSLTPQILVGVSLLAKRFKQHRDPEAKHSRPSLPTPGFSYTPFIPSQEYAPCQLPR
jgi:hypothetical protein